MQISIRNIYISHIKHGLTFRRAHDDLISVKDIPRCRDEDLDEKNSSAVRDCGKQAEYGAKNMNLTLKVGRAGGMERNERWQPCDHSVKILTHNR